MSHVRVDLRTSAWRLEAVLPLPDGPVPFVYWLPFLRALADRSVAHAEAKAKAAGRSVSCARGCGACCRQLVGISLIEAQALAALVEAMPEPRRSAVRARFEAVKARTDESGLYELDREDPTPAMESPIASTPDEGLSAAWFALRVACPFLENESCSIYEARPLVCREHLVTSPSVVCSRPFVEPVERLDVFGLFAPRLAAAVHKLTGVSAKTIPLVMSLDMPPIIDAALSREFPPLESLKVILNEIGEWRMERVDDGDAGAAGGG
jgi:Fe-S-cluster containining protein